MGIQITGSPIAPAAHATTHNSGGSDALAADAAAGTPSLRSLGTTSTTAAAGNDARLSDARTPSSHGSTHRPGGSDATEAALVVDPASPYTVADGVRGIVVAASTIVILPASGVNVGEAISVFARMPGPERTRTPSGRCQLDSSSARRSNGRSTSVGRRSPLWKP